MNNPTVQVYKNFHFSKQDWHPDGFGLRSPFIPEKKKIAEKCYIPIVECVLAIPVHTSLLLSPRKPTAERRRSHRLWCTERETTSHQRRREPVRFSTRRSRSSGTAPGRQRRKRRGRHPNADRFTIVVDSGASDHVLDGELVPRLQDRTRDLEKLGEPTVIVSAGS